MLGGRLVLPIGSRAQQHLTVVERTGDDTYEEVAHEPCVYVPLIGQVGFAEIEDEDPVTEG